MDVAHIDWIPEGTRFGESEMTYFAGRGERDVDDALADVDLIITGPHASAAFPAELQPYVDVRFTRRLQHDFTDVSTSPIARRWAEIDPHVLYVEDPHPRAVRDANRAHPADVVAELREAFERLGDDAPTGRPSLAGVDAVRPVTFGYLPVYVRPQTDSGWNELGRALAAAGELGIDEYERVRDGLIDRVIEAKLRKLSALDPRRCSVAEWRSATMLDVLSIHDTMNHTAQPDGAICLERPPADRLPQVVAVSNRGDAHAEVIESDEAALRAPEAIPTMRASHARAIGNAYRIAFDAWGADDVAFNRPYIGGYETTVAGARLRAFEPLAIVRLKGGEPRHIRLGAFQNEFLREFLLGPESTDHLMRPGTDWVRPPDDRVQWVAERLRHAHDLIRGWGDSLDR